MEERRLTIVPDEMQAEMVRSVLGSHGIASVIRRPALGELQWGTINVGMGGAREIVVAEADLEQARLLLDEPQPDVVQEPRDPELAAMDAGASRTRVGWGIVVILLFGVPIAIWLLATLAGIVDGMG